MQLSTPYFQPYFDIDITQTQQVELNNNYEPRDIFKICRFLELTLIKLGIISNITINPIDISGGQKIFVVVTADEQHRQKLQKVINDNVDNSYIPLIDITSLSYPSFWLKTIINCLIDNNIKQVDNVLYLNFLSLTTSFNYEYVYISYLNNIINKLKTLYTLGAMVMTEEQAQRWQCTLVSSYSNVYKLQNTRDFGFIFDRLQDRDYLVFVGYNKVVKHDIAQFYKTIDQIPIYYLGYVTLKLSNWLDYDNIDKINNIKFTARGQVQTSLDFIDNAVTYFDLDDNKKQLIYSIKT